MIRVNRIVEESFVDGPGRRTAVFLQGCPIKCESCFAENTSVLMADGTSKAIKDVMPGDLVYTHTGRVQRVTNVFVRDYQGKMIKMNFWKRPGIEILSTPDHPFLNLDFDNGKFHETWIGAEDLSQKSKVFMPTLLCREGAKSEIDVIELLKDQGDIWTSQDGKLVRMNYGNPTNRFIPIDENLMRIVGYFLAEGWIGERSVSFAFHIDETDYVQETVSLAEKVFGVKASVRLIEHRKTAAVNFGSGIISQIMRCLCGTGACAKRIHNDLMNQAPELLWHLAITYFNGDGYWYCKNGAKFETVSRYLPWQLWTILNRLGIPASIRPSYSRNTFGSPQKKPVGIVYMSRKDTELFRSGKCLEQPHSLYQEIKVNQYQQIDVWQGKVYNLEVEFDHSYIVAGVAVHNCQNKALWPAAGGQFYDEQMLAVRLAFLSGEHGNVTISGGEPFAQPGSLARLVHYLKAVGVKHIIVYSGYTWDILLSPMNGILPWAREVLERIDVLVDGPFVKELDDNLITYRGSRNQRPIDVAESLSKGKIITLDWDEPEVVITPGGDVLFPVGLTADLAEIGPSSNTRMCGMVRQVRK